MPKKVKTDSKLQGASRLVIDATLGVTDVVEEMHNRIVHPPMLPSTGIQRLITKIASLVYNNVRWTTKMIGSSVDTLLGRLVPLVGDVKSTDQREALRATLNGVIGDYLDETDNPLKIEMKFRYKGKAIVVEKNDLKNSYPEITDTILLMIHGSSMNDLQWTYDNHNHGETIARELTNTPVYLYYNSGKHISSNGQELSLLLDKLVSAWPVPLKNLTIISHSMGGLVTRSAIHYAEKEEKAWFQYLKKVVFLGTPHHGSPVEKKGNIADMILENIPYTKPLAPLGKIRSAGVTDLRYGNLIDDDWEGADRFERRGDQRTHIPLPIGIENYSIAASTGKERKTKIFNSKGDGLVPIKSALGIHKKPEKQLNFKQENTRIFYECNHIDLLRKPEVCEQLIEWLR